MAAPARRRAAVLGHPIAHSLSPVLHRAAYRHLGLSWSYDAMDVNEAQLPGVLASLGAEWAGLSLTMPLKEAALPLLTEVDPEAALLRSVNTVVIDGPQRSGHNTDVAGLTRVLEGVELDEDASVTVLGAGATARSATAALARLGRHRIDVCARRPAAARAIGTLGSDLGVQVREVPWPQLAETLGADLVISTVPLSASAPVATALPRSVGTLVDVLYAPWPSPLAAAWEAAGGRATGGLAMLVHQAVEQVRLMTGRAVPSEVLTAAVRAELQQRKIAQGEQ